MVPNSLPWYWDTWDKGKTDQAGDVPVHLEVFLQKIFNPEKFWKELNLAHCTADGMGTSIAGSLVTYMGTGVNFQDPNYTNATNNSKQHCIYVVIPPVIRLIMQIICSWANGHIPEFQYPERHWVKQMRHDFFYLLQVIVTEGRPRPRVLHRLY